MESAALFIVASKLGVRAGSCFLVVANQEREKLGLENPVVQIANGAAEIDMVINIGWLKDKKYDLIEEEKVKMCEIVTAAGADYIKTSTGFSTAGATFADIELFAKNIGENVKVKAAGGISTMAAAEKFVTLPYRNLAFIWQEQKETKRQVWK